MASHVCSTKQVTCTTPTTSLPATATVQPVCVVQTSAGTGGMNAVRAIAAHEPLMMDDAIDETDVHRQLLNATTAAGERLFQSAATSALAPRPPADSCGNAGSTFCACWMHMMRKHDEVLCDAGCAGTVDELMATVMAQAPRQSAVQSDSVFAIADAVSPSCVGATGEAFTWIDLHGVPPAFVGSQKRSYTSTGCVDVSGASDHSEMHAPHRAAQVPSSTLATPCAAGALAPLWHYLGVSADDMRLLNGVEVARQADGDGTRSPTAAPLSPPSSAQTPSVRKSVSGSVTTDTAEPVHTSTETSPDTDALNIAVVAQNAHAALSAGDANGLMTPDGEDDGVSSQDGSTPPDAAALTLADLYCEHLEDLQKVDAVTVAACEGTGVQRSVEQGHYVMLQLAALLEKRGSDMARRLTDLQRRAIHTSTDCHATSAFATMHRLCNPPRKSDSMSPSAVVKGGITPIVGLYVLCFPNLCVTWCPSSTLSVAPASSSASAANSRSTHIVQGWESLQQAIFARCAGTVPQQPAAEPLCTATFLSTLLTVVCSAYLPDTAAILSEVDAIDAMMPLICPEHESDQVDALRRVVLLRRKLSVHRRLLYQKIRLLDLLDRPVVHTMARFLIRVPPVCADSRNAHSQHRPPTATAAVSRAVRALGSSFTSEVVLQHGSTQLVGDVLASVREDTNMLVPLRSSLLRVHEQLEGARVVLGNTTLIYSSSVARVNSTASTDTDFFQVKVSYISLIVMPLSVLVSQFGMNCMIPGKFDPWPRTFTIIIGLIVAVMVAGAALPALLRRVFPSDGMS